MNHEPAAGLSSIRIGAGDAMIVVDVQNDFLPGGALAVPDGDRVVPASNRYLNLFNERSLPIFATRDWHPVDHCSFQAQGGPWPPHCVANTTGAAFAPALALPPGTIVVSKGTDAGKEAYSGFQGTDMAERLHAAGARRLFVGGLATEFCVLATVSDGLSEGFTVCLLLDGIQALEIKPGDARRSEQEMINRGAIAIHWENVA